MSDLGMETAVGSKRINDELNTGTNKPPPTNPFNVDLNGEPLVDPPGKKTRENGGGAGPNSPELEKSPELMLEHLNSILYGDKSPLKRSRQEDNAVVVSLASMPLVDDDPLKHPTWVNWAMSANINMVQALIHMSPEMRDFYTFALGGAKDQVPDALRGRKLQDLSLNEFKSLVDVFSRLTGQSITDVPAAYREMLRKDWLTEIGNKPLTIQVCLRLVTKWKQFKVTHNLDEGEIKKLTKDWLKWMERITYNKEASTMATMLLKQLGSIEEPIKTQI